MYYIYRSESSNNIVHVTQDSGLYPESRLIMEVFYKENVEKIVTPWKKEICWCDENPIPDSLTGLTREEVKSALTHAFDTNWKNETR